MKIKDVKKKFSGDPEWQWCIFKNGKFYSMKNIGRLFDSWTVIDSHPVSLARMINNLSKSEGVDNVGFSVNHAVQWFDDKRLLDPLVEKGRNDFKTCIRCTHHMISGATEKKAVIKNNGIEKIIPIGTEYPDGTFSFNS